MNEQGIADKFLNLTDSLSKYRRAELTDDSGQSLVEELYVDPLDNDLILKSMLKDNTTLLMGRKGTGKSTIINRFQNEVRKSDNKLSLYIDVKALFEQTKKSYIGLDDIDFGLPDSEIERLNLYVFFIEKVIDEIKKEIKGSIFSSRFSALFRKKGITKKEFEKRLDILFEDVRTPLFKDVTSYKNQSNEEKIKSYKDHRASSKAKIKNGDCEVSANYDFSTGESSDNFSSFNLALRRFFDIIGFMNNLKYLLEDANIKKVFICLDDMSEIDKASMEVFTDFVVAPLNNLSDEFFKFKISLYPGRDYLPSIDRQKVKTHCLDYYDLYSVGNVDKIEESAVRYTKKLIETRVSHYFKDKEVSYFFDVTKKVTMQDYYKLLFQVSSNVPRIIGKILEISLQKTNSLEKKINRRIIQESARQHYKNDIEFVLSKSEYIEYKSYDEYFEKFHLKDLLDRFIEKATLNKKQIGSSSAKIFQDYTRNTAPSNYLYISGDLEEVLKTLEFNFFITKFSEQKDKDNEDVSVFSLNYGLCYDKNIIFDEKSDRKFRIERVFDYNNLIREWMLQSKEVVCSSCGEKYDFAKKEIFIDHGINCQKCNGKVVLNSVISQQHKKRFEENFKVPIREFEILNALKDKKPMTSSDLGNELDRAYQSINHSLGKNSKIKNFSFIKREVILSKPLFSLTDKGSRFIEGNY